MPSEGLLLVSLGAGGLYFYRKDSVMYTSKERLLLDKDDKVVKPGDPKAVKLLVAEGGDLSDEDARKYGLIESVNEDKKEGKDKEGKDAALPLGPVSDKIPATDKVNNFGGSSKESSTKK